MQKIRKRIKTLGAVAKFFSFSLLKKIIKRKRFLKEDCKEQADLGTPELNIYLILKEFYFVIVSGHCPIKTQRR